MLGTDSEAAGRQGPHHPEERIAWKGETMESLLLLFGVGWLAAMSWLVWMAKLLNRLCQEDPELYRELQAPVLRWLWWQWPTTAPSEPPRLWINPGGSGRLALRSDYSLEELGGLGRLLRWIVLNQPRPSSDRGCRRLRQRLRLAATTLLLSLASLVALGLLG